MTYRALKKKMKALLLAKDMAHSLQTLIALPPRKAVNPLFSFFYSGDALLKWRAVTVMGMVVSHLADQDMESSRVIMRRLMWNLNDESGGIGWGSPEAMGEITAQHELLSKEFACILISYADPKGNYLEHEMLQRGVLWGLGRLMHSRPGYAGQCLEHIRPFFDSPDPEKRGLAIWATAPVMEKSLAVAFNKLKHDTAGVRIYKDFQIVETSVGTLASAALEKADVFHDHQTI